VDAEETPRRRAGRGDRLRGGEAVLGQQRDLLRDRADDIGACQDPHPVGDGVGEAVAELLAQLVGALADLGIGGVAVVEHGAQRRRPRAAARAQRFDLGMAKSLPVLDRIRADHREPRVLEVAVHRHPRPGGMGGVDRLPQRVQIVGRGRRLRYRAVRAPHGGVADDLHPRRPGRHLSLDSRYKFAPLDGGVHARKVAVRGGEESAGGGHHGTAGYGGAREFEGDVAAAPDVADHSDAAGGVFGQARRAVFAVGQERAVLVPVDGRVRVCVDQPGHGVAAG
jgi:hypothetical protein